MEAPKGVMNKVVLSYQQAGQIPNVAGRCVRLIWLGVNIMIPILQMRKHRQKSSALLLFCPYYLCHHH